MALHTVIGSIRTAAKTLVAASVPSVYPGWRYVPAPEAGPLDGQRISQPTRRFHALVGPEAGTGDVQMGGWLGTTALEVIEQLEIRMLYELTYQQRLEVIPSDRLQLTYLLQPHVGDWKGAGCEIRPAAVRPLTAPRLEPLNDRGILVRYYFTVQMGFGFVEGS